MAKIDQFKAYDRLSWDFLERILIHTGFPSHWVRIILQCVKTISYTLLLNGQVVGKVWPKRKICQGDLLSPYLFILCANALSMALLKAENEGCIHGVKCSGGGGPSISHLLYADDLLLTFKATVDERLFIRALLDKFGDYSGLRVNNSKSVVVLSPNLASSTKEDIGRCLGMKVDNQLGRYLGVHLDGPNPKKRNFEELIDKINSCLCGWKAKCLSQEGRMTLIKSVIQADPVEINVFCKDTALILGW